MLSNKFQIIIMIFYSRVEFENDFFAAVNSMLSKEKFRMKNMWCWNLICYTGGRYMPNAFFSQIAIDLLEKENERLQNNSYTIVDVDSYSQLYYWRGRKVMSWFFLFTFAVKVITPGQQWTDPSLETSNRIETSWVESIESFHFRLLSQGNTYTCRHYYVYLNFYKSVWKWMAWLSLSFHFQLATFNSREYTSITLSTTITACCAFEMMYIQ